MSALPEQQSPPRVSNEEFPRESISRDGSAEQSATPQPHAAQPTMDSAESTERLDAVLYSDASRPGIAKKDAIMLTRSLDWCLDFTEQTKAEHKFS
jgi:hypothetical protein